MHLPIKVRLGLGMYATSSTDTAISSVGVAATAGIITNVIFADLSLIAIIVLIPRSVGKTKRPWPTTKPAGIEC